MLTFIFILMLMAYWGASIDHVVHLFIKDEAKMERLTSKYGEHWVFWSVIGAPIVFTKHLLDQHLPTNKSGE